MDLLDLLKKPEGKTLEFKRDLSSPEKALRSLAAFANTSGGVLLIGVEDKSRRVCGVPDSLLLEERLANLISDSIQPRLLADIEILPWRQHEVLAVQIYPSPARPHYLKSLGDKEGVFVRVGSTNRQADQSLIEELRRLARNESYDETPIPELNSEAIDFRVASELFAPMRKLHRGDLLTLHLLVRYQGREVPTVGGVLLFGQQSERQRRFPDGWIQAGLFEGKDRTQILDTVEIRRLPVHAVEEAITFIKRSAPRGAIIGEVRRTEHWAYPLPAVREAIINSIVHADYAQRGAPIRISLFADRLEIENPGLLPAGLTVEDIRRGISKLRNRVMGRVFHELNLIEQWGSGIQRMTAACREAGLSDPVFEEIGTHFRVTLLRARSKRPIIAKSSQSILDLLERSGGLATNEIARKIKLSPRATRTQLLKLIENGHVVEVGTGPNDPKRRYHLADK
jgi:ATP-dependent DNA helicase RecG